HRANSLRKDGPIVALAERPHRRVGVEAADQNVPELTRLIEIRKMPVVKDVETTVGRDDALAPRTQVRAELRHERERNDLSLGISGSVRHRSVDYHGLIDDGTGKLVEQISPPLPDDQEEQHWQHRG